MKALSTTGTDRDIKLFQKVVKIVTPAKYSYRKDLTTPKQLSTKRKYTMVTSEQLLSIQLTPLCTHIRRNQMLICKQRRLLSKEMCNNVFH